MLIFAGNKCADSKIKALESWNYPKQALLARFYCAFFSLVSVTGFPLFLRSRPKSLPWLRRPGVVWPCPPLLLHLVGPWPSSHSGLWSSNRTCFFPSQALHPATPFPARCSSLIHLALASLLHLHISAGPASSRGATSTSQTREASFVYCISGFSTTYCYL